jgi:hypothetical protein
MRWLARASYWLAWASLVVAPRRASAAPPRRAYTGGNASSAQKAPPRRAYTGGNASAALASPRRASGGAAAAWSCAALSPVKWSVKDRKGGGKECRFTWPTNCAAFRHFGKGGDVAEVLSPRRRPRKGKPRARSALGSPGPMWDPKGRLRPAIRLAAAQVLSATHLLLLGNSVVRMLALTLHELLRRPKSAGAVDAVKVGAHTLPDTDNALCSPRVARNPARQPVQTPVREAAHTVWGAWHRCSPRGRSHAAGRIPSGANQAGGGLSWSAS